ncbi:zinc-ribbon domain-containing protein [Blastopirellula sp. JC732]|uniref:Zinc-ribbon domain-containing protein n=1 Tax=Blastopirellula sediminis TaxID=2894196 RepID=A0A9X1MLF6_9BACT|nr:zinc-ribbon domain-containing protein [Blastopirellula sediminis]MCC9608808.1 zinc-ribbon domain-containing protein [Blastopirellula sediminis]MCC9628415.1 zinc-ribbon domain-containing protein [Blastopirellula sediminis]
MQMRCPHCSTVLEIQSPAGTQVQCPSCSGQFMVPDLAATPAAPPAPPVMQAPQPPTLQAPSLQTRPNAPGRRTPAPKKPKPAAPGAEGEATESDEEVSFFKKNEKLIFNIVAGGVGAVALFLVFAVGKYLFVGSGSVEEPDNTVATETNTNVGNKIQDVMDRAENDPDFYINWADATRKSLNIDGLKVKVHHVEWGEVRGQDERGELVTSGQPFMVVFLEIGNRSSKPIDFKTWYGTEFKSPAGFRTAQLSDEQRNVYYPLRFDDIAKLKWNTPEKTFEPKEDGTDSIVFDVGENFNPKTVQNLYLDLPGQAVGGGGSFRFKVPRSMIQGLD